MKLLTSTLNCCILILLHEVSRLYAVKIILLYRRELTRMAYDHSIEYRQGCRALGGYTAYTHFQFYPNCEGKSKSTYGVGNDRIIKILINCRGHRQLLLPQLLQVQQHILTTCSAVQVYGRPRIRTIT